MNTWLSPAAALGAAATLGVADFAGGVARRRTPPPSVAVGIEVCGLVALPLALWFLPMHWDLKTAIFTFAGGAAGGFGLILFYRAIILNLIGVVAPGLLPSSRSTGPLSLCDLPWAAFAKRPVDMFYPAFTILCARLFTHERLSWTQTAGAALAVVAIALIAAT